MRIKLIKPNQTLLDVDADKVSAPGRDGYFQILPRHIDATWSLRAGILTVFQEQHERYFAINEGFLVKRGDSVQVACLQAVEGESLQKLEKNLQSNFRKIDEMERMAREVLVKLEVDVLKRFVELEK
ncbi:F0F1 ATP synthase subunit epsilon [Clostridia bacterium]|nr:F0F1 ATP synthase subunit epsilon [Clostridia bacterium]